MGNPVHRTQAIPRQKWNTGQKWDSAVNKGSRSSASLTRHLSANERMRPVMNGEHTNGVRGRTYFSGELAHRPVAPAPVPTIVATRDAATNTDSSPSVSELNGAGSDSLRITSVGSNVMDSSGELGQTVEKDFHSTEMEGASGGQCYSARVSRSSSPGSMPTSIQTEKEGSHSRLLSRGGESSSFRGKQFSTSSRIESVSFRKETVSSSFRKELGSRRKERKATKSFQDGELSSIASDSARGSPCSIHYNQAPFSLKGIPAGVNVPWTSSPSSPDIASGKSNVPFHWEEAPGRAKTIAAAAEMALARKLARDESLRRLSAATPRGSVDGSFRMERKGSQAVPRGLFSEQPQQVSGGALPLPPSKRVSQELSVPRKDSHSSQLIEDLKAAVVRKQAEDQGSKLKTDVEDDSKSVISDFGGETHIDLIAPAAAKFLNRQDDHPVLTPVKTPLAVPFKWEEAPGKPKDCVASPSRADPPSLSLPPRLLGGCRNPSKEQQTKILQTYSGNLIDLHWNSSGNPTPLSRSREGTPTRRERTPTRRDRTPTKRDISVAMRDITPTRRDPTPTRSYFPRVAPKSGHVNLPSVALLESVRDQYSGPLRSNTGANYLNIAPKSVSQEFARVSQESALTILARDLERLSKPSEAASGPLYSRPTSRKISQELQIVRFDPPSAEVSTDRSSTECSENSLELSKQSVQDCRALVKVPPASAVDPLSPTSILCGPDISSQRSVSNLSSAYAESSHSHRQDSISGHTKSESSTSLESLADDTYNLPPPWAGTDNIEPSPYRDLGPIDIPPESVQGSKTIEDGVRAIVKFCRKAKRWNKSKAALRKAPSEPDMWAPTLATYFQKIEIGGTILPKATAHVFPESKEAKAFNYSGPLSVPCSPLGKFTPRAGELGGSTPDHLGARRPLGSMTPVHVITTCRSPQYRVLATDECFSLFSMGKVWSGTKARQAKWGRKMRRSSRFMVAVFAALKRSMLMKCGKQTLPNIHSDRNLLDDELEAMAKEPSVQFPRDAAHSLSADHQFHRPL